MTIKKTQKGEILSTPEKEQKGQNKGENSLQPPVSDDKKNRYRNVLTLNAGKYPFKAGDGDLGIHREKSKRINTELGKYSLTEKQSKILDFVSEHIGEVGFPPTVRQIAEFFNVSAKAAHDHLRAIAKKGYLRIFPGHARGMEVIRQNEYESESNQPENIPLGELMRTVQVVPLLGTIAAGVPILAEENIDEKLTFPKAFLPATGNMFALRVKGDSMEDQGIYDGDIAVLSQVGDFRFDIRSGDIVAALLDGEATLKTIEIQKNKYSLVPANKKYRPIELDERNMASIVGKLVGVFRSYR